MIKVIAIFLFCMALFSDLIGQNDGKEDVIHLKNHWVIRGSLLHKPDSVVSIKTREGNVFVFPVAELASLSREKRESVFENKTRGFAHYTELGPLVAGKTTINGVTTAAFSLQTVNGYKFSTHAMLGLGLGADLYATQTIIPVFGSFRGDIGTKGSIIPFYFADLGYGVNITESSASSSNFRGGILYAAGVGVKIPFNRSAGFLLSLGYRYQQTFYTNLNIRTETDYSRLAIRAGFFL